MNAHSDNLHSSDDGLAPFIDAARRDVPAADVAAATARFRAGLPDSAASTPQRAPRWGLGATAAMLLAAFITVPLLLPFGGGMAFADVQQWFADYRTLRMNTRIQSDDTIVVDVNVAVTEAGDVRIEQAGVTHIVDASAGAMYTLMPDGRYFSQPVSAGGGQPESLEWVRKIRAFQGEAELLPETSLIDGVEARGFRLRIDDTDLTLWAERATDKPLRLEGALPGSLTLETTFEFDQPLSPALFELPAGAELIPGDGAG